ncbi:unnamed protein product [Rotaria sp. Silwood2]|nr:unnamed protein product [Rotaria sp. Silwood2]CAF4408482.1 unnamed protein product [Rotaria sp. Silwood2]
MLSSTNHEPVIDRAAFEAYTQLRTIAKKYNVEDKLEVPQLVLVGETSTGKSMLVQNFLRFPCSFSQTGIATRCPVAYRLVYNPTLLIGELHIIRPAGITPPQLANYLQQLMRRIQEECCATGGFRLEPEWIEIESAEYTDFEILDLPGLIGGDKVAENRKAVEKIAESFVRNPRFSIVLLKETTQITDNSHGARVIDELCKKQSGSDTSLPPRSDYHQNMITIHTKFDSFMLNFTNGTAANNEMSKQLHDFGSSFFTNMIFDGYSMAERSFDDNVAYLRDLPRREQQEVDKWIEKMNQKSGQLPDHYQRFDEKYRKLIGIDVVRNQIQSLWLKSFRSALPKLRAKIQDELDKARRQYDEDQERYKSEIDFIFPLDRCGQTYEEIETAYNEWNRKKTVTWRAYLSVNDLKQQFPDEHETINVRYVGGRHFVRLHNLFSYMILHCKPREPTRDWIESAASLLAAGTTDFDDLEKAVRDILRTLLRETFLMGICWLTQMYSYLLDVFRINVKRYLLSNQKYPTLRDHNIFLNAVDLEYHIMVRTMIRDAIRLIRDYRQSTSAYAHYDIMKRMSKLMFSVPREIEHEAFNQPIDGIFISSTNNTCRTATLADIFKSISPHKLLEQIYGSESFLTNKRDPYTCSHHENARRTIKELYTASCGRLLEEIRSSFNTYVVMRIHNFDRFCRERHSDNPNRIPLSTRIDRMTERQIAEMSNLCFDEINDAFHKSIEKIQALNEALLFINNAITEMNSGKRVQSEQRRSHMENINLKSTKHAEYMHKKQETVENRHRRQYLSQSSYNRSTDESNETLNENTHDEEQKLMTHRDPTSASEFLREIYDKHDKEDLKYGFLENDPEDQDKNHLHVHDRLRVDQNAMNYEKISSPSTGKMSSSYQTNANNEFVDAASAYDEQSSLKAPSVSPNSIILPPIQNSMSIDVKTECMRKEHGTQLGKR